MMGPATARTGQTMTATGSSTLILSVSLSQEAPGFKAMAMEAVEDVEARCSMTPETRALPISGLSDASIWHLLDSLVEAKTNEIEVRCAQGPYRRA